ncbi:MAG: Npt1/Npt2 family nucleotide transporter [bacterium]
MSAVITEENNLNRDKYHEILKVSLLSAIFFCIIGSYSILRPLKTSIFFSIVGKEYQPLTKFISIFALIPALLLYAKLIDKLKRYQVVYLFFFLYAGLSVLFAYLLTNSTIGLPNTNTSVNRIFGWIFYLFVDLFSPLIVSTFWAFVNSIYIPNKAQKNYGIIVAVSRVGGILTTGFSWLLINQTSLASFNTIPILTAIPAILLIAAGFLLKGMKKIPKEHLIGYEEQHSKEQNLSKKEKTGILEGLQLMFKQPYVFGIFGLVYSFEIISVIFDYQMQVLISIANNNELGGMTSYMLLYTGSFQVLALIFAIFGTSRLLKSIGTKKSLLLPPIATIILILSLLFHPGLITIFIVMVVLRALHYGFNTPVREILYIPTTKDIKFKSKSWIDSFGRTLSKTSGSTFNWFAQSPNYLSIIRLDSLFCLGIVGVWGVISFLVGKKYEITVDSGEIIGQRRELKPAQKAEEPTIQKNQIETDIAKPSYTAKTK